jgi:hypothetical protein
VVLRLWRFLLYTASVLLVAAAALQASGDAWRRLGESAVDPAAAGAVRALRASVLLQWLAIVGLQVTACVRPQSVGRSALFWCGLLAAMESVALAVFVGVGWLSLLLGAAALAVFAAILTRPTRQAAGAALG